MGRYYFGMIAGKFWFAVQDSDDATNFGVFPSEDMEFNYYCPECEEYGDDWFETEDEVDIPDEPCSCGGHWEPYSQESQNISYEFTNEDVEPIKEVLNGIKDLIPGLKEPTFEGTQFEYELDCDVIINNDNTPESAKLLELEARWYLGQQILACIEKHGYCNFGCEC